MIVKMAYETEEKNLNADLVERALNKLILHPVYGYYFFIIDKIQNKFCGMNLVTFEHNINLDKTILWLQSVYVEEKYRMKGLFRKLLYKNEDYVLENKNSKKVVKLYMDKDNEKAEKVYYKVGFKMSKDILYELDFHFDDISELKAHQYETHQKDKNIEIKILGTVNSKSLHQLEHSHKAKSLGIFNDLFYNHVINVFSDENILIKNLFDESSEKNIVLESLINSNKINFFEEKEKMLRVISNRNLGTVLIITDVKYST